jgi:ABC-2 type transport system permease protein
MPFRILVSVPVAIVALVAVGRDAVTHDPTAWALWAVSILGAWLITLSVNFVIGCLAFFMESSMKLMDAWLVFFFVLSGYMIPIELFPARMRSVVDWLPFRYQMGLPVEIMTGVHASQAEILELLGRQWAWVAIGLGATMLAWRRGLRQFAAYGG